MAQRLSFFERDEAQLLESRRLQVCQEVVLGRRRLSPTPRCGRPTTKAVSRGWGGAGAATIFVSLLDEDGHVCGHPARRLVLARAAGAASGAGSGGAETPGCDAATGFVAVDRTAKHVVVRGGGVGGRGAEQGGVVVGVGGRRRPGSRASPLAGEHGGENWWCWFWCWCWCW